MQTPRLPYLMGYRLKNIFVFCAIFFLCTMSYAQSNPNGNPWQFLNIDSSQAQSLTKELNSVINETGGMLGVGVYNLKTEQAFYYNGDKAFPMASTYKIAIAMRLLQLVENKKINLNKMISIKPSDFVPGGSGVLSEQFYSPGISVSILNLLQLMIRKSDNTATDILLEQVGGPSAVTQALRKLGITTMQVDRSTFTLMKQGLGIDKEVSSLSIKDRTIEKLSQIIENASSDSKNAAMLRYENGTLDTTTPKAMVMLLKLIAINKALNQKEANLLMKIMANTETGANRLKKLLPNTVTLAHKTGSFGRTANDVGYIVANNDPSKKIIIVVFVNANQKGTENSENAIAQIANITYQFFKN